MSDLPDGWEWSTLADAMGAGVFSDGDWVESKDQDPTGAVRLVQLADVGEGEFRDRSSRYLTIDSARRMNCTFLEAGDVLVARMPEPLGRACRLPELEGPAVTAVDVCILRPTPPGIDPRWLMWCLNAPQIRSQVAALQSGTTRKRISRNNLSTVRLPVAPRREQERIVAAVEQRLSRLDVAQAALTSAELRVGLFARSGVAALFGSADWPWTTLGEIADIKGGVTKDSKRENDATFVEVPYLRVANVQRGFLDLREVTTIRVDQKKANALRLEAGDVLFNEGGDRDKLGRGWVWEGQIDDCIHQNHVFRARLKTDDFEPYFVSTHANTWGQAWFEQHGRQTTNLASLNLTTLKQFPVPAPPRLEQNAIVGELTKSRETQARLTRSIESAGRRAVALRRSILVAALSGQLVPQDTSEEPASVLLDRIRAERAAPSSPRRARKVNAS